MFGHKSWRREAASQSATQRPRSASEATAVAPHATVPQPHRRRWRLRGAAPRVATDVAAELRDAPAPAPVPLVPPAPGAVPNAQQPVPHANNPHPVPLVEATNALLRALQIRRRVALRTAGYAPSAAADARSAALFVDSSIEGCKWPGAHV